jgi:hypothetical protein
LVFTSLPLVIFFSSAMISSLLLFVHLLYQMHL